ncbi:GNAT family N-acetyltransferase [Sporolactobacillus shoreae]|uniref:GNAT family N-acetyltransferase n=1 Tax=Sporolactobacillus shoreae TaxID=1465501 RepID=A0A4Z0GN08_9BACL|nr:GNAT family N-acetyltransferase [Sporolactobacillus shoreae]TGA97687.1 GNAT family N-acetyltransferase [Sporolactobacillus shoreae]
MIRTARVSDFEELSELCLQLGYEVNKEEIKKRLQYILENKDHAIFVYEDKNGLVSGWAHIFGKHLLEGVYAELGGIVVDTGHRRQGIGKMLINECEKWSTEQGYSEIRVRSGGQREKAHQFYSQIGYENTKWQKVFRRSLN